MVMPGRNAGGRAGAKEVEAPSRHSVYPSSGPSSDDSSDLSMEDGLEDGQGSGEEGDPGAVVSTFVSPMAIPGGRGSMSPPRARSSMSPPNSPFSKCKSNSVTQRTRRLHKKAGTEEEFVDPREDAAASDMVVDSDRFRLIQRAGSLQAQERFRGMSKTRFNAAMFVLALQVKDEDYFFDLPGTRVPLPGQTRKLKARPPYTPSPAAGPTPLWLTGRPPLGLDAGHARGPALCGHIVGPEVRDRSRAGAQRRQQP